MRFFRKIFLFLLFNFHSCLPLIFSFLLLLLSTSTLLSDSWMYQLNNTHSIQKVLTFIVSELDNLFYWEVGAISAILGGTDRANVRRRRQKTHEEFWDGNKRKRSLGWSIICEKNLRNRCYVELARMWGEWNRLYIVLVAEFCIYFAERLVFTTR